MSADPNPSRHRPRYVYLVDSAGYVRWRGCGAAAPDEVDVLLGCTQQLCAEEKEVRGATLVNRHERHAAKRR